MRDTLSLHKGAKLAFPYRRRSSIQVHTVRRQSNDQRASGNGHSNADGIMHAVDGIEMRISLPPLRREYIAHSLSKLSH